MNQTARRKFYEDWLDSGVFESISSALETADVSGERRRASERYAWQERCLTDILMCILNIRQTYQLYKYLS
jgi:hypothetical protein